MDFSYMCDIIENNCDCSSYLDLMQFMKFEVW